MDKGQNLSQSAIRRAVLGQSLQHPSVIYPAAIGILGGIGATVIVGSPFLLGAAALAGGAAAIALATNYFARHDRIAGSYLAAVRNRMAEQREAQIEDLANDLKEVKSAEAERQLERFVEKLSTFRAVLGERLSPTELTFARFSAIAEAVFLAGIDNLRSIHLALMTLRGIDEGYISRRLADLAKAKSSDTDVEATGLKNQLQQAALLRERVKTRLGQNELAMAELNHATSAVGEMQTGTNRPTLDMEAAMQELARIAQRSGEY